MDNSLPLDPEPLHLLEETRDRLLETMFSLRGACAAVFADPRRSEEERDVAAWDLARAVGDIRRCDEELQELREANRDSIHESTAGLIASSSFG